MKIVDERNSEVNGTKYDRGILIYPFLDETASEYQVALAGYLQVRLDTYDWNTGTRIEHPEARIGFNMQLRQLTVKDAARFQVALSKAMELALTIEGEYELNAAARLEGE